MAQRRRNIGRTLFIGATVATAFVIVVFAVCNFAATLTLSWSLYPIFSVLLGYFTIVPLFLFPPRRAVLISMGVLSVLYIPFIALMCALTNSFDPAFPIAATFATIGMIFLWCIVLSFWLFPRRPRIALAIIFFVAAIISYTSVMALQAVLPAYATHIQGWQFLGVIVFVPLGAIFAGIEYVRSAQATRRDVEAAEKKARRKAARKGKR